MMKSLLLVLTVATMVNGQDLYQMCLDGTSKAEEKHACEQMKPCLDAAGADLVKGLECHKTIEIPGGASMQNADCSVAETEEARNACECVKNSDGSGTAILECTMANMPEATQVAVDQHIGEGNINVGAPHPGPQRIDIAEHKGCFDCVTKCGNDFGCLNECYGGDCSDLAASQNFEVPEGPCKTCADRCLRRAEGMNDSELRLCGEACAKDCNEIALQLVKVNGEKLGVSDECYRCVSAAAGDADARHKCVEAACADVKIAPPEGVLLPQQCTACASKCAGDAACATDCLSESCAEGAQASVPLSFDATGGSDNNANGNDASGTTGPNSAACLQCKQAAALSQAEQAKCLSSEVCLGTNDSSAASLSSSVTTLAVAVAATLVGVFRA